MGRKLCFGVVVLALLLASCGQPAASPVPVPLDARLPAASRACTSFCLDDGGHCVFGTNFDNTIREGLLFVNKRNVSKTGWDPGTTGEYASWTSKYGSFTFNLAGYQLVWAGMNEAGLAISTMALPETQNPAPDERPPLVSPLWMQYQLDNCGTVEEVLASDSLVRIADTVDHYLVCDRTGDCAAIEFLGGQMVYRTDETMPVKALTNRLYDESVRAWHTNRLSGNALRRFGIAADRVTSFEPSGEASAVAYAFDTLAGASQEQVGGNVPTQWSIVFDTQVLRVYFRTQTNSQIRSIDFGALDFSCGAPAQMLDIHEDLSGDISGALVAYSHQAGLDHLIDFLDKYDPVDMSQDQIEAIMQHLEGFVCTAGDAHPEHSDTQATLSTAASARSARWVWLVAAGVLLLAPLTAWYVARRRSSVR